MKLEEVKTLLTAQVLADPEGMMAGEVAMACGCDLMSDVLAFTKAGSLLLTGLTNPQVVRTAEVADIKAICFVRGKKPNKEVLRLAEEQRIVVLATHLPMFESCGILYHNGLRGCSQVRSRN